MPDICHQILGAQDNARRGGSGNNKLCPSLIRSFFLLIKKRMCNYDYSMNAKRFSRRIFGYSSGIEIQLSAVYLGQRK